MFSQSSVDFCYVLAKLVMRLNRYFSRRLLRFAQYLIAGGLFVLLIPTLMNRAPSSSGGKVPQGKEHEPHMLPGMNVAPDPDKPVVVKKEVVEKKYESVQVGSFDSKDPSARFRDLPRNRDWHDYEAMKKDEQRSGPGEQGQPVALPKDPETQKLEDQIYRVNGFDGLASDQISLNRSIKDIRHPQCKTKKYLQKLPTVTVILPFHNEVRVRFVILSCKKPGITPLFSL